VARVIATACGTVDALAIVNIPLDPNVGQIDILGMALARFPCEESFWAVTLIKLNFSGTMDVSHGSLVFQARIKD
jgi:hypothetical protein